MFENKDVGASLSQPPKPGLNWTAILFFAAIHLFALIGIPLYVAQRGFSLAELLLLVFYLAATGLSITAGYHRLFAHRTYQAKNLVTFLALFFGAAAFEQSALKWASQHRDHHRYTDTDRDPYNIKKGFWYAHIGWMLFWKHTIDYSNVKDLVKNRLIVHQHINYTFWAVVSGVLIPTGIGYLLGCPLGAFLIAVCGRIMLVYQSTFCINSICHMFGKATYDIHASGRDNWVAAFLTYGEGYHNFHHHFPTDYRNGVRWYQWDPTKWLISTLNHLDLAYNLRRYSTQRILRAKIAADNLRVTLALNAPNRWPDGKAALESLQLLIKTKHEELGILLEEWEMKKEKARARFRIAYKSWRALLQDAAQFPKLVPA